MKILPLHYHDHFAALDTSDRAFGMFFLHVSRPKADQKIPSAINQGTGPFGEIVRGPRGKLEIALTFDAGTDRECFEDLIAARNTERAGI